MKIFFFDDFQLFLAKDFELFRDIHWVFSNDDQLYDETLFSMILGVKISTQINGKDDGKFLREQNEDSFAIWKEDFKFISKSYNEISIFWAKTLEKVDSLQENRIRKQVSLFPDSSKE